MNFIKHTYTTSIARLFDVHKIVYCILIRPLFFWRGCKLSVKWSYVKNRKKIHLTKKNVSMLSIYPVLGKWRKMKDANKSMIFRLTTTHIEYRDDKMENFPTWQTRIFYFFFLLTTNFRSLFRLHSSPMFTMVLPNRKHTLDFFLFSSFCAQTKSTFIYTCLGTTQTHTYTLLPLYLRKCMHGEKKIPYVFLYFP